MSIKDRITYSQEVYDLACTFLVDSPKIDDDKHRHDLATHIQQEIESWITFEEEETGRGNPSGG